MIGTFFQVAALAHFSCNQWDPHSAPHPTSLDASVNISTVGDHLAWLYVVIKLSINLDV